MPPNCPYLCPGPAVFKNRSKNWSQVGALWRAMGLAVGSGSVPRWSPSVSRVSVAPVGAVRVPAAVRSPLSVVLRRSPQPATPDSPQKQVTKLPWGTSAAMHPCRFRLTRVARPDGPTVPRASLRSSLGPHTPPTVLRPLLPSLARPAPPPNRLKNRSQSYGLVRVSQCGRVGPSWLWCCAPVVPGRVTTPCGPGSRTRLPAAAFALSAHSPVSPHQALTVSKTDHPATVSSEGRSARVGSGVVPAVPERAMTPCGPLCACTL